MTLESKIALLFLIDLITIIIAIFGLKLTIQIFCSEEDRDEAKEIEKVEEVKEG
jgi:hypothetical protein